MGNDFREKYLKNLGKLIERCEHLSALEDFSLLGPGRDDESKLQLSKRLDAAGLEDAILDVYAEHALRIMEIRDGDDAREFAPRAEDADQADVHFAAGFWNRARADLIEKITGVEDSETHRYHRYAWDLAAAALPELRRRHRHFSALVALLADERPPAKTSGLLDFGDPEKAKDLLSSLT